MSGYGHPGKIWLFQANTIDSYLNMEVGWLWGDEVSALDLGDGIDPPGTAYGYRRIAARRALKNPQPPTTPPRVVWLAPECAACDGIVDRLWCASPDMECPDKPGGEECHAGCIAYVRDESLDFERGARRTG